MFGLRLQWLQWVRALPLVRRPWGGRRIQPPGTVIHPWPLLQNRQYDVEGRHRHACDGLLLVFWTMRRSNIDRIAICDGHYVCRIIDTNKAAIKFCSCWTMHFSTNAQLLPAAGTLGLTGTGIFFRSPPLSWLTDKITRGYAARSYKSINTQVSMANTVQIVRNINASAKLLVW